MRCAISFLAYATFFSCAIALTQSIEAATQTYITRDVAIIGGGAAGTYAAVRLREDYNISVVLIEADDRLGGHVNTFFDPASGVAVDYGVQAYLRYGNSKAFFNRFNIATTAFSQPSRNNTFPAVLAAMQSWADLISKYDSLVLPGLWNFPTGDAIPEELLTPFGQIAEKSNLSAAVPTIASISNVGVGGIDNILALYVMQAFGTPVVQDFLASALFVPANGSNSLLYQRAQSLLSSDLLLSSQVESAKRDDSGVALTIKTPFGTKYVTAKQLLFTPPPSLDKLTAFGLDATEIGVLSTWTPTWSFAGVVYLPGLPEGNTVNFYAPAANGSHYRAIRDFSTTFTLSSTGPPGSHLFRVLFASNTSISNDKAKQVISDDIDKLCSSGTFPGIAGQSSVEFKAFVDHNSILSRQSPEKLKDGFIHDLLALQGRRKTYFTGGLWTEDYTGTVWAFTDSLLPRLLANL
ncbi:hypothetical protein B9Z65_1180 [Elsinoe australis]|uniref:Beta-cyclopiazonate dehydrogenase n=1 Tax=Elsinoe australis TaxID=40998 RepID=A0A2P7YPV0_9PEZI|nr:hypothetical protein B9Z65_1180 [Elsinoe australis]